MALFYFGKSRVFLPKLIGSFVAVLAVVMFVVASGSMFDSWDAMKKYPKCLDNVDWERDDVALMQYLDCKDSLYRISGLQLRQDQPSITVRQFVVTLLRPVAELLFWAAVFIFGLFLYNSRIVRDSPKRGHRRKRK